MNKRVKPLPQLTSSNEAQIVSLCKDFHKLITEAEESRYDLEMKIIKQDYEVNELTIKVNDIKGKFIKPALKKVNKTQSKYVKFKLIFFKIFLCF